jgi:adenosyl cobinamide kinase/adenosyl cobinamide phosphate guanylyltransferase
MALRAIKPEAVPQRMKALFYGAAGVGKSTAAIQFPKPYWIDTEGSADKPQYVKLIKDQDGVVFQTQDFDELMTEVKSLLTINHDYKTLIVDSLTILYNDLVNKAEIKVGNEFGKHYNEANKRIKHLLNLLLRLDMNVIITSHAKNEYGNNMVVLGQTFDCYKKLDYLFDLVFEIQKRGQSRIGLIRKSRIEAFPDGEQFPFSYDEIANLYGREVLERHAVIQEIATCEQVAEIKRLLNLMKIPEETSQKWLDKSNSEKFEEMPRDSIQKCINHLKSQVQGETK